MATWTATLWLDDIQTVEHSELGLARLIKQYRDDRPRLQGELEAYLESLQSIEDVSIDVMCNRWPLTAVGVQLDILGKIVGQERGEYTDDQYRLWILARILVNRANGRIEELIDILEALDVTDIKVKEYYPAGVMISVAGTPYGQDMGVLINEAKPGGVQLHWVYTDLDDDDALQMSATLGASDSDADSGLASLGGPPYTSGGYFSGETT